MGESIFFNTSYESPFGNWQEKRAILTSEQEILLQQNIYVYKFTDAKVMQENSAALKQIFFNALGITGNKTQYFFSVTPNSGWVNFENRKRSASTLIGPSSFSLSEIESIGQSFFSKLKDAHFQYASEHKEFTIPYFFPVKPKLQNIIPVVKTRRLVVNWIVRYQLSLPFTNSSGKNVIPVKDSLIELRIDNAGNINSLLIRWKPVEKRIITQLNLPENWKEKIEEKNSEENHSNQKDLHDTLLKLYHPEDESYAKSEEGNTSLQYYLSGANTRQSHLSPQLIHKSGHHADRVSLVNYSLNIRFGYKSSRFGVEIEAVTDANQKGSYQYSWLVWEIARPENNFVPPGSKSITVQAGAFQVLVTVTDAKTGYSEQHQELVYATEPVRKQFETTKNWQRLGCTDPDAKNYDPDANCDDGSCTY